MDSAAASISHTRRCNSSRQARVVFLFLTAGSALFGQSPYAANCSGCHGADAKGGERGPNILDGRPARADLDEVIRNGRPDSGMPVLPINASDRAAIVRYVTALRAPAIAHPSAGDQAAGERFFFGAGKCSTCHMVNGRGGINGPDLSNLARDRRTEHIERSLRQPSAEIASGYHTATVRLANGESLRGYVKNQSDYDLQLMTFNGKLHLLRSGEIASRTDDAASPMPPVTGPDGDLLAYLTRLSWGDAPFIGQQKALPSDTWQQGDWPTYHGKWSGNRDSALSEITPANIAGLAPRWIFRIANSNRLEVTPVVADGVMYVTAANQCWALDARTGREIWHYARPLTKGTIGDAGGAINRGVALRGDRVFMVTDHAHLIALHRSTGQLLWDAEMADFREHYGATSAPLVAGDLVLSGTSGGDEGARGFIDAYRADTGERAWRFWTMPKPGDPLASTWVGRAIEHGCTTAWLTGTYDAALNTVYWPTGNPCPDYNGDERKGDNLYSSSVLALDPASGKLRWHFQFTPHDLHDWDAAQTPMLVDAAFRGKARKLLLQANRNGFFYVLDRTTGEFLLGEPFVKKLNWATGIGKDGRPATLRSADPTPQGTKACPAVEGASNWMSTAYSGQTKLFYVMALEKCNIYTKSAAWWEPGRSFYGGGTRNIPGEPGQKFLRALDIETGRVVWQVPQSGSADSWGGVLSTAGGVVFLGDDSGALAAVEARTGRPLWHFHTSQVWKSSPMTYALDGKQYIGVSIGSDIIAFSLP